MTTAEMLASLEAQIRKDIPRLMELREGCKFHSGYGVETIVCIKGDKEDVFIFKDLFSNVYETNEIPQHYKIIGHEIMLNDVLAWLNNKFYEKDYFITSKGIFGYRAVEYDTIETYILRDIKINLHFPYLKDQSEELIKFLYNLIKE
ncbi:hypothetical protein CAPN008_21820 [Capnocytophaga canis]|uniref:hypothetical protein n=1 Tax=Capnocytophaga canis TaxID=1848903 RepID=UPI001AC2972D|nr:hypothetical protein [Capnocytophaga canis]GIM62132.1 hypothetical protein CAPN008_21820 [Capnocytophaga canis]